MKLSHWKLWPKWPIVCRAKYKYQPVKPIPTNFIRQNPIAAGVSKYANSTMLARKVIKHFLHMCENEASKDLHPYARTISALVYCFFYCYCFCCCWWDHISNTEWLLVWAVRLDPVYSNPNSETFKEWFYQSYVPVNFLGQFSFEPRSSES